MEHSVANSANCIHTLPFIPVLSLSCTVLTHPGMWTGWEKGWESGSPEKKNSFFAGWCSARSVPQPALHTLSPVRAVHGVPVGMRWISEEQGYPQSVLIIMDFGAWCHMLQTCLSKIGVTLITSQSRNEQQQPLKWHQCSAPLPETWDTRSFVSRLHSSFPLL